MTQIHNSAVSRRSMLGALALTGSATLLAPLLAACGSSSSAGGSEGAKTGPGPGGYKLDLGGYQGPTPTSKEITIRVLRDDFPQPVNEWFTKAYAAFRAAYPNITISEELVPFGALQQKVQVYIQSGNTPDIMMGRTDLTTFYGAGKLAVDLEPYLTKDYLGVVRPSVLAGCSYSGGLYVMPWEDGIPMIVYNADLFRKAGVALPPSPTPDAVLDGWTIEDFLDTLGELQKGLAATGDDTLFALEASTLGNGGPGSNYCGYEGHYIRMMGDPNAGKNTDAYKTWAAVSPDGFQASGYLDSDGAIQGMQNYQSLFTKGITPKGAIPTQFAAGRAAVGWEAMSLVNRYTNGGPNKLDFDWGVTVLPRGKTFYGCNQAEGPIVSSTSKHPAEAIALLSYLCNTANRLAYHTVRGSVPAREDILDQMPIYQKANQKLGIAAGRHYVGAPKTPGWADYFTAADSTIKDIALGADVTATLHQSAKSIDTLLSKYR